MEKIILTILLILTTTINVFSQDNIWVKIPNYESKRTEVLSSISDLNITQIIQAFPSSRNSELQEVYQITCDCDVNNLLDRTSKNSNFVNPELGPNYQTLDVPNDYSIYGYDYALNSINATEAWDLTHGDTSIVIAITDANYYIYHEELAMKVNWVTQGNGNTNYIHGTAVSTIAAGNTDNGAGKSSIGWNSHVQLRMMSYDEILAATYTGAKVINASWASGCYFSSYGQMVIDEAHANGSTIVASAGNGSTCNGSSNFVYPASFNHVISVTSIGSNDNHERTIGNPSTTHQHNSEVDLSAPGYDVLLSTAPGQYMMGNGTSFAAPYVSGTIALMLSVNPCLTNDQIEYILKESADSSIYLSNPSYVGLLGSGKLDSYKSVLMAKRFNTFNGDLKSEVNCITNERQGKVDNLNGEAPYTYEWSNGSTMDQTIIDTNGLYSVEIIDNNGCKFYGESEFITYNGITSQSEINHISCYNMNNGSISVVASGGDSSYTYEWSNGDFTNVVTNLEYGNHQVIIRDQSNCIVTEDFIINQPEPLVTSLSYIQPTETTFGSIDIEVNGGTQPYTYSWNHGETSEDLMNIVADFYEVGVTDANGCASSQNVILTNLIDIEDVSGINEINSDKFNIFPNPTKGNVTINNLSFGEVLVSSLNGKLIGRYTDFNNGSITLENLTTGVYLITFNQTTQKLIVE